jgi:DNA-binding CsgD family transcriptional regulator/PAS domain-containing protein
MAPIGPGATREELAVSLERTLSVLEEVALEPGADLSDASVSVVESLGRALAMELRLEAIGDVVLRELVPATRAAGVVFSATTHDAESAVVRSAGVRRGERLAQPLQHGDRTLGAVSLWVGEDAREAQRVLAAVAPWLGLALAAVRGRHDTLEAQRRAEAARARRMASEARFFEALARHPEAVFLVDEEGQVQACNTAAEERAARDPEGVVRWIASAGASASAEVWPVPLSDGVLHLILAPSAAARSLPELAAAASDAWRLTARQSDILLRTLEGLRSREIASALGCAEVTIEKHLTAVFRKAGVRDRQALVVAVLHLLRATRTR